MDTKDHKYINLEQNLQDKALLCDGVDTESLFKTFEEFYRPGMSHAIISGNLRDNNPGLGDHLTEADMVSLVDVLKKWQKKQKFSNLKRYLKFYTDPNGEEMFQGIYEKRFATDLTDVYHLKTLKDTKEILYYGDDGVYHHNGETLIHTECERVLGEYLNMRNTAEITAHVRGSTYVEREELNGDLWTLNLKNGLFNTKTFEFTQHTPDLFTTIRIPVDYDESADCPAIRKFLSEIVYENDVPLIEEIIGYCLYHGYLFQNWFLLEGEGANGKSTLLSLIGTFLGEENTTAIGLQDLNQRFAPVNLYGKSANIVADLSDADLKRTARLKQLTGGDLIAAEPKFKDGFNYRNFAKLIYSCNRVPITEDKSRAFFRRVVFISFPHEFAGTREDKHLLDKLTTEEELRGLLNLAIRALKRLLDNEKFTGALTAEEKEELYERASNTVYGFFHDGCEIDVEKYTAKPVLYEGYCEYCKEKKIAAISEKKFIEQMKFLTQMVDGRRGSAGHQQRVWLGIVLDRQDRQDRQGYTPLKDSRGNSNLSNVLSKENDDYGDYGGYPKEGSPKSSTAQTSETQKCDCGKLFDTLEMLHQHQANCPEFQRNQDMEANVPTPKNGVRKNIALENLITSLVENISNKDERGALTDGLPNRIAKNSDYTKEKVEAEIERLLREGKLMTPFKDEYGVYLKVVDSSGANEDCDGFDGYTNVERLEESEEGLCEECNDESEKEITFTGEKNGHMVLLCENHAMGINKWLYGNGGTLE